MFKCRTAPPNASRFWWYLGEPEKLVCEVKCPVRVTVIRTPPCESRETEKCLTQKLFFLICKYAWSFVYSFSHYVKDQFLKF